MISTCTDSELLSSTTTDVKYLPGLTNVHIVACYLGATWLCIHLYEWYVQWTCLNSSGCPPETHLLPLDLHRCQYHSLCFLLRQHANLAQNKWNSNEHPYNLNFTDHVFSTVVVLFPDLNHIPQCGLLPAYLPQGIQEAGQGCLGLGTRLICFTQQN